MNKKIDGWTKTKGSVASMCARGSGSALYATSDDGRFHVWVSRWRTGGRGHRDYHYLFKVVDRFTPPNDQTKLVTHIPVGPHNDDTTYDPEKAIRAANAYAAAHPRAARG